MELELEAASPAAVRRFLARHAGLDARPVEGPREGFDRGATLTGVAGARAAGLAL